MCQHHSIVHRIFWSVHRHYPVWLNAKLFIALTVTLQVKVIFVTCWATLSPLNLTGAQRSPWKCLTLKCPSRTKHLHASRNPCLCTLIDWPYQDYSVKHVFLWKCRVVELQHFCGEINFALMDGTFHGKNCVTGFEIKLRKGEEIP